MLLKRGGEDVVRPKLCFDDQAKNPKLLGSLEATEVLAKLPSLVLNWSASSRPMDDPGSTMGCWLAKSKMHFAVGWSQPSEREGVGVILQLHHAANQRMIEEQPRGVRGVTLGFSCEAMAKEATGVAWQHNTS